MPPGTLCSVVPSTDSPFADCDELRNTFTLTMAAMYKAEVPLYGDMVDIVEKVNQSAQTEVMDPNVHAMRFGAVAASRINIERHGAIRLGTPYELQTIRRLFAIIGLHPVGYYNLAAAGLPMHATCFRPVDSSSLHKNPFRVFTSVLRHDLIKDAAARDLAVKLLSRRQIFTGELLRLLDVADMQGGRLTHEQGKRFITEAMETFRWHGMAACSWEDYQTLRVEHPILADIACFKSSHINHLTPRTLDIVASQAQMKQAGLMMKARIEGPPARACPILLRQTSFLAIEESIKFPTSAEAETVKASHRARFGEVEERGAAVTPKGRELYDQLLEKALTMTNRKSAMHHVSIEDMDQHLASAFSAFPDNWEALRKRGLIYNTYRCTGRRDFHINSLEGITVDKLVERGIIAATPITYEDFLPLSAAGIFQSNLGHTPFSTQADANLTAELTSDISGMEKSLGAKIMDPDELYRLAEIASLQKCALELGIIV